MHIPEKYRKMYDALALSHPWMREWRDEEEPPEGDAVAIMRKASFELHAVDYARLTLEALDTSDMFATLADMVERDYVSREKYENTVKMCDGMHSDVMHVAELQEQVDELKKQLDTMRDVARDFRDERDEWRAKADKYQQHMWEYSNWHTATAHLLGIGIDPENWPSDELIQHEIEQRIIDLGHERDGWKAKAEEAERAMNAAAGKWAKADDENRELRKMLLLDDGTVEEYTERADPLTALAYQKQLAEEWRDRCHNAEAWCDKLEAERDKLKAINERLQVALDAVEGCDERCKKLEAERDEWKAKLSDLHAEYYDAACAKDAEIRRLERERDEWKAKAESCGQVADMPDEIQESLNSDSREKLEADVRKWCGMYAYQADMVWGWLNRQDAITRRGREDAIGKQALAVADLGTQVDRLKRENVALARDLGECMAERDGLQSAYDEMTRIAADLCRACGFAMVDASGEVL